jgi:hypothetical protein
MDGRLDPGKGKIREEREKILKRGSLKESMSESSVDIERFNEDSKLRMCVEDRWEGL